MDYEKLWKTLKLKIEIEQGEHDKKIDNYSMYESGYFCRNFYMLNVMEDLEKSE